MRFGFWYTQTFENGDQLWYWPVKRLKHGGTQGVEVFIDAARPRAAPAKQGSVHVIDEQFWDEVHVDQAPERVFGALKKYWRNVNV